MFLTRSVCFLHQITPKIWKSASAVKVSSPRSMTILLPYFFVLLNVTSDMYSVYKLHHVVCFFQGNSLAYEFCMPTFRNTLSVSSS
jgi:hypothetical protein